MEKRESMVKIQGRDYKIKPTLRALFLFEEITGRTYAQEKTIDVYLYFFCLILANNENVEIEWDGFIDAVDANPGIAEEIAKILGGYSQIDALKEPEGEEGKAQKKN